MSALVRAELFKQRSTRTSLSLAAGMIGVVAFAVLVPGFGVGAGTADTASKQLTAVLGPGEVLGVLFAALVGAMSVTTEIRHGTIRPTFLVSPWRARVISAKAAASIITGAGFGLAASAVAAAAATAALQARGIDALLDGGDYALFIAGGGAAAALWATIGVGVGAVVRNQVPALIGLCVWLLFVETLLLGDAANLSDVARFLPGAAAQGLAGQDPGTLLAPVIALVLLSLYAAAAVVVGARTTSRRDLT
jgi:ABC-2 type transport system permease protein